MQLELMKAESGTNDVQIDQYEIKLTYCTVIQPVTSTVF